MDHGHDEALLSGHGPKWSLTSFSGSLGAVVAVLLGAFVAVVRYPEALASAHVDQYYMFLIHVNIMIFIGFGFLMTFLKRYSYSAVALNFILSAVVVLEFIVVGGAVQQFLSGEAKSSFIELDLPLLIDASFCAGAAMIAFGAVLGKTSPAQLLWLLVLMVPVYSLNQHLVFDILKANDIGGSISIHAFGAYFGLAASLMLAPVGSGATHSKNGASYVSDVTAMIGTTFLWIYWPSFNGALASSPIVDGVLTVGGPHLQFYCIVNTIIALLAATVTTFVLSPLLAGKLDMVHIQNATLAGGVAAGSSANLAIEPAGAMAIGIAAGTLSCVGYVYVQKFLEGKIGLKDTCGVHNLHGMPGVLGGLTAAIVAVVAFGPNEAVLENGSSQWLFQMAAVFATVAIAVVAGLLAGAVVGKISDTSSAQKLEGPLLFEDAVIWHGVEYEETE